MSSLIKISIISQFVLMSALSINTSSAAKLYKWVDDQGRISYQDQPPPLNSKILSEKTLKERVNSDVTKPRRRKSSKPVDVYVTKSCPSCQRLLEMLNGLDVAYTEKSIEDHREIQTQLLDKTGGIVVPALFDRGVFIENISTTESLRRSLEETGYLEKREPEVEVVPEKVKNETSSSEDLE